MTNDTTDEDVPDSYTVFGWATVGPSYQIEIDSDESIEDIDYEDHCEGLRDALRSRGFTAEQLNQMHIEIDEIVEDY